MTQAAIPNVPILTAAPNLPAVDPTTLIAPTVTWFDGNGGELSGTAPQKLDMVATLAAWQAAYEAVLAPWREAWAAEVAKWQAACAALLAKNEAAVPPVITLATDYPAAPVPPAPPAFPPLAASAVWLFDSYHMTHVAPPALQPGFRPVYNVQAGTWAQVEDHRNLPLWDANGNSLPHMIVLGPLPTGALLAPPPPTAAQIATALASAKAQALQGVLDYANQIYAEETAIYSKPETAGWFKQYAEALAFTANAFAPTPLLAKMAANAINDVPVATAAQIAAVTPAQIAPIVAAVMAKAAAFDSIAAAVIYMRSNAQSAIAAAPDLATLATTVTALEAQATAAKTALGI